MQTIYPKKLKKGDNIRVIVLARSMKILGEESIKIALKNLQDFGFNVSFGRNVNECDEFNSSSIKLRIDDLHEAFLDKNVDAIFTVIGGYNSNQLLNYIDYEIIKNNPKILCGFSDITTISNTILAKTGIVGYSGPHFSSFGMKKGFEYTKEYFEKCCMQDNPYEIISSKEWSDDPWYIDQEKRNFIKNEGYWIINEGKAEGKLLGGHLPCVESLFGTEFFPQISENTVFFIESDAEFTNEIFDRNLQSLIHQPFFHFVKGIVIGRFQKNNNMTKKMLEKIIKTKKELDNIPVIANVDFGHTTPFFTFPIGGEVEINTDNKNIIKIFKH